jgi:hypothetical protein
MIASTAMGFVTVEPFSANAYDSSMLDGFRIWRT